MINFFKLTLCIILSIKGFIQDFFIKEKEYNYYKN